MITRRSWFVYGILLAIWVALIGWQGVEHVRVRRAAQQKLVDRTRDISTTLAVLLRSQRFFGIISRERLESALTELVNKPGELHPLSVEVVNIDYEKVASAGPPIELPRGELPGGVHWDDNAHTLTLQNLVDLGTNWGTNIVMSPSELFTNRPPGRFDSNGPPRGERPPPESSNLSSSNEIAGLSTNLANGSNSSTNGERRRRRGRGDPERPFEKPYWMSQQEFQSILQKNGAHGFVVVMSTQSLETPVAEDWLLRGFIILLGTIAVGGYALAWRNADRTSELQIRLVRASEANSHLKEMNLAAAGLAHETRNPLNIVRGLAQMISKRDDAPPELREKTRQMIEETDRVTAQLNEFINYSRPREVRRAAVNVNSVVTDVARALSYDLDEKKIGLKVAADSLTIEADEQLLRQVLFNLVLNATQAVPEKGEIQVRAGRQNGNGAYIEVADNGPGISPENRTEIFKPYFTTHAEGTGLGLAVVQQIVMAHGWEIACAENQPSGAVFRITHLKLVAKTG